MELSVLIERVVSTKISVRSTELAWNSRKHSSHDIVFSLRFNFMIPLCLNDKVYASSMLLTTESNIVLSKVLTISGRKILLEYDAE